MLDGGALAFRTLSMCACASVQGKYPLVGSISFRVSLLASCRTVTFALKKHFVGKQGTQVNLETSRLPEVHLLTGNTDLRESISARRDPPPHLIKSCAH